MKIVFYKNNYNIFFKNIDLNLILRCNFLIVIMFMFTLVNSQDVDLYHKHGKKQWSRKEWRKANTARFSFYMSKRSRETIRFMNLARMYGPKFSTIYLQPISNKDKPILSLIYALETRAPKKRLRPSFGLHCAALIHAVHSGYTGETGHSGFEIRTKLFSLLQNYTGENCHYGSRDALEIILDLLVDRGSGTGHRENILREKFSKVGAGHFFHKGYGTNMVHDFSSSRMKENLFHKKPEFKNFGADVGLSFTGFTPQIVIGGAYYTSEEYYKENKLTLRYKTGILKRNYNALEIEALRTLKHISISSFLLGVNLQYYFNSYKGLYLQPKIAWFIPMNLNLKFKNRQYTSYTMQFGNQNASLFQISYGYNLRWNNEHTFPISKHNLSIIRYINLKTTEIKKSKKRKV